MIPKKIHYCWFGSNAIPEKDINNIETWKKYCPDYEIIRWSEENYDVTKNKYMYDAYLNRKMGFVPDYARFDIIYNEGGIYLDTDVEIVKPLDDLISNEAYLGIEEGAFVNGGIGFGAEAHNEIIKGLRDMYDNLSFINEDGSLNLTPSPYFITDFLVSKGYVRKNCKQNIEGVTVYPSDYFSPKSFSTGKINCTSNTYTIHHYNATWLTPEEHKKLTRNQKINRIFGLKLGTWIVKSLSKIKKLIINRKEL